MKKEKKFKVGRLAGVALLLTMVTTCLLSNTLAKYTTALGGSDSARVAAWKFTSTNMGDPQTQTINVFASAYNNAGNVQTVKSIDGDKVVAPGTSGEFKLQYNLVTEVTTRIAFAVAQDSISAPLVPMIYEYDNKYYSDFTFLNTKPFLNLTNVDGTPVYTEVTIAGSLSDMATAVNATVTTITAASGAAAGTTGISGEQTIKWHWAFEEDGTNTSGQDLAVRDTADTKLGLDAANDLINGTDTGAVVELTVVATATQVD